MSNMLAARDWTEGDALPGKGAPVEQATDMCNTLCTDSSVVFVPRHQMEVCPLARRIMLPHGSTPLHLITRRPSLAPSSCTRRPIG